MSPADTDTDTNIYTVIINSAAAGDFHKPELMNICLYVFSAGIIIRIDVEGISQFGRNAQGVKLMTLNDDDKVVSLAAVQQAEDDVTEEVITDDVQTETVDVSDEIIETSQATEE